MNNKTKKTRYHMIPPEYNKIPEGKEALAQRIAAQRQRLIEERWERRQESKSTGRARQEPLLALASIAAESVPAYAVELVKKKPFLSLLMGAGVLILVPLALRKIGTKRLVRGVNALSPLLMDYLSSRYSQDGDR